MNKIKVTRRVMSENYRIISIGYCNAEYLLQYENPIAYSAGVYGWACDYYNIAVPDVAEVVISTGYSPIAPKRTKTDYKTIEEYNNKARDIIHGSGDFSGDWEAKKTAVRKLLEEFVAKSIIL